MKFADNRVEGSLSNKFRRRRYDFFVKAINLSNTDVILDIGSGEGTALEIFNAGRNKVIGIDLKFPYRKCLKFFDCLLVGNGINLPFKKGSIDIVFSSSVIEHLGGYTNVKRYAKEVRRVARRYFIQTPCRYFPIEPHTLVPFFQFFPEWMKILLVKYFSLGWYKKGEYEKIIFLSKKELHLLFPDAEIRYERFLGLNKSIIAVKNSYEN